MSGDELPQDRPVDFARELGFRKGLNFGLLSVSIPCVIIGAARPFYDFHRIEEQFHGVKVPLPGLTLLVFYSYQVMAAVLILGLMGCFAVTRVWGHQKKTVVLNGTLLFLALAWQTLVVTAIQLLLISVFEGIGGRH